MKEISEIGKFLRLLRLETGETLKEMSKRLGYATTYLSGIENGKRDVPKSLYQKVVDCYKLDAQKAADLDLCILRSQSVFEIENAGSKEKKEVLVRMVNNQISEKHYEQILKMLQNTEVEEKGRVSKKRGD